MFKIIETKKEGICKAYRCSNKQTPKDRFCGKHRHRYNKENNPVSYKYNLLRSNARRRGKGFDLSLEEFEKFCADSGYLEDTGKTKSSASIDRIDPSRGYSIDNIQVITLSENTRKMHADNCPF